VLALDLITIGPRPCDAHPLGAQGRCRMARDERQRFLQLEDAQRMHITHAAAPPDEKPEPANSLARSGCDR
jgi:hypothetical protein